MYHIFKYITEKIKIFLCKNMNKEIVEFINRRFPVDCDWIRGNCYYFSLILSNRFPGGSIYYDTINGHFVYKYNENYYDWTGCVEPDGHLVEWDKFDDYDPLQKQRIINDCIL